MKKLFSLVAGVSLLIFAASCEKEQPVTPPVDNTTDSLIFATATAGYYGTENSEAYNYYTQLATTMQVDSNGYYASAGQVATLDLYSVDSVLTEGTYTLSSGTYAAGTCDVKYTKWYEFNDKGEYVTFGIKSGTVKVAKSGEKYVFTVNLVDSLDKVRTGYFTGDLMVQDQTESTSDSYAGEPETPTQATFAIPSDSIAASNYGDVYEIGADNISLEMWDQNGGYIALELLTTTGATTLPVGTFNVATTYAINTLLPGSLFWGMFPTGSYAATNEAYFWLETGSVTIALTENVYTITVAAASHFGSTINATYTGAVTLKPVETEAAAAPAKNFAKSVKKAPHKHITTRR